MLVKFHKKVLAAFVKNPQLTPACCQTPGPEIPTATPTCVNYLRSSHEHTLLGLLPFLTARSGEGGSTAALVGGNALPSVQAGVAAHGCRQNNENTGVNHLSNPGERRRLNSDIIKSTAGLKGVSHLEMHKFFTMCVFHV